MTRTHILPAAFAALFALALASCAGDGGGSSAGATPAPAPEVAKLTAARARLNGDIAACTAQHGYDPFKMTGLPENALAPGELAWRDCAYKAARTYARANPSMRLSYELLIHDDRTMTAQLQAGTMTRTQRRAAVDARLADIRTQEEAQLQAAQGAAESDQQQMRNTVETMRVFAM